MELLESNLITEQIFSFSFRNLVVGCHGAFGVQLDHGADLLFQFSNFFQLLPIFSLKFQAWIELTVADLSDSKVTWIGIAKLNFQFGCPPYFLGFFPVSFCKASLHH